MGIHSTIGRRWSAALLLLLSGCAIAPVIDDVAHVSASNIARQVRCEARQAVIEALLGYLTDPTNNQNKKKLDDYSFGVGNRLREAYELDHDAIRLFDPSQVTGFANTVTKLLYSTGIACYYDLTGLETNNFDPVVNFIRPVPISSLLTLGVTGKFDRMRQNEWTFTITDNFRDLVQKTEESLLHALHGDSRELHLSNHGKNRPLEAHQGIYLDEFVRES